ncbi:hypothetical protein PFISCL1PPCAC_765, partial [Pristionchus fissidentatus]
QDPIDGSGTSKQPSSGGKGEPDSRTQEWMQPAGTPCIRRPYVNVDEVLRIGSVLERRIDLTETHRQSFDWIAFHRGLNSHQSGDFFRHIQ